MNVRRLLCGVLVFFAVSCITASAVKIKGKVVDAETGNPVVGIDVICEHHENRNADEPDDFRITVKTADDGSFSLETPNAKAKEQYMAIIVDAGGSIIDGRTHIDEDVDFGTVKAGGGFDLTGVVFDSTGNRLPKAKVKVRYRFPKVSCTHFIDVGEVETGSDGGFDFSSLPEGEYSLQASAERHAPISMGIEVADDLNYAELRLELGATVKGKITDAKGSPLAGIKVSSGRQSHVLSGKDGAYELSDLPAGRTSLRVISDDYVLASGDSVTVTCSKGQEVTKDLQLSPAGRLSVVLKKEKPSVKVPKTVNANLQPRKPTRNYSYTSRRASVKGGVAEFTRLPEGDFSVSLSGDEMANISFDAVIEAGKTTKTNAVLKEVFSVSGRVDGSDGRPVEKASVQMSKHFTEEQRKDPDVWEEMGGFSEYDWTGEDGLYELSGIPEGKYEIKVSAPNLLMTNLVITLGDGKDLKMDIKLERGLAIKGSVLDADGSPVAGLQVRSVGPKEDKTGRSWSYAGGDDENETAADGSFEVGGLARGTYDITISDPDSGDEVAKVMNVSAGSDETMVMLAQSHAVKVLVKDENGKPVEGAIISSQKLSDDEDGIYSYISSYMGDDEDAIKTDAQGSVEIKLREGSKYQVSAVKKGLLPGQHKIDMSGAKAASQVTVSIVLKQGSDVDVTVLGEDGKPLAGLSVKIQSSEMLYGEMDPFGSDEDEKAVTDAQGKIKLQNVAPGVASIIAYKEKDDSEASVLARKRVQIKRNAPNTVVLEVGGLGIVKGSVKGADGQTVSEASIYMYNPARPQNSYNVESDEKGAFLFEDVAPGDYMLTYVNMQDMESSSRRPLMKKVTVKAGQTSEITLEPDKPSESAVKVSGTVTEGGKPAAAGQIYFIPMPKGRDIADLMGMYSEPLEVEVDDKGAFTADAIEPGEYVYRYQPKSRDADPEEAMASYYGGVAGKVKIDNKPGPLEIKIPELEMKIEVVGENGTGLADAQISIIPEGSDLVMQQLFVKMAAPGEKAGEYGVKGMEPGTYTVHIRVEGSAAVRQGVKFDKGAPVFKIKMGEGYEISGKVAQVDGGRAQGAGVIVFDMDSASPVDFATVGVDGSFKTRCRMQEGNYALFAVKDGYAVDASKVKVDKDISVNFTLKPGGDIDVALSGADPKKLEGRALTVRDEQGKEVFRIKDADMDYGYGPWGAPSVKKTDKEGATAIKGLLPGKYTVEVDGTGKKAAVTVKPLETAKVKISL